MRSMITAAVLILTIGVPSMAIDDKIADRLWESSKVLDELMNAPDGGVPKDLLKKADDTCKKIATLQQCGERALGLGNAGPPLTYTPPPISQRVTQLLGSLENFVAPPTTWQLDQIKLLDGMLKESAGATRKLVSDDLASLNKMMNESGVPHIVVPNTGRGASATASNEEEEP